MELDRHSSFSHSPEMAKRYAAWLAEDHVLVLCAEVQEYAIRNGQGLEVHELHSSRRTSEIDK
jgi:hypothetical protein